MNIKTDGYLPSVLFFQYGLHIRRQRRAEANRLSRYGMLKPHFAAMQRLTRDFIRQAAVEIITKQRMSQMCHMTADLVSFAGFKRQLDI